MHLGWPFARRTTVLAVLAASLLALPVACDSSSPTLRELSDSPPGASGGGHVRYGPGDYERTLRLGEVERRYEVHVPPSYDGRTPLPLVLNFHGGGGNPAAARRGTKMDTKSDSAGFILVYPAGSGRFSNRLLTWNGGRCCGYAVSHQADDVGFTEALLTDVRRFFEIDPHRVYSTGLSNGAIMSYRLACELPHRFAAIAAVSGPLEFLRCNPERPVPVLHIHGTADQNAPYAGGTGSRSISRTNFNSVPETIRSWVAFNRCEPTPATLQKGHLRTDTYRPGPGGAEVVLVTIEGGGHVWPGGDGLLPRFVVGSDAGGLNANDAIWEFFRKHRLP